MRAHNLGFDQLIEEAQRPYVPPIKYPTGWPLPTMTTQQQPAQQQPAQQQPAQQQEQPHDPYQDSKHWLYQPQSKEPITKEELSSLLHLMQDAKVVKPNTPMGTIYSKLWFNLQKLDNSQQSAQNQ